MSGEILRDNLATQAIFKKVGFKLRATEDPSSVSAVCWNFDPEARAYAIDAGLVISSCGSNFRVVPRALETRHSFSARFNKSSALSRSSADAIFRFGRTTIWVKL